MKLVFGPRSFALVIINYKPKTNYIMKTIKTIARVTGVGYLVIFISGIFANFFILEGLVVAGDASTTLSNIIQNTGQFRLGIVAFLVMVIADVLLAWTLYRLLEPVSKQLSQLSAWLRLVNGSIFAVALYHLFNVLNMVSNPEYIGVLGTVQLQAQVMLSIDAFNYTWLVGLVFFGIHLLIMGYLLIKAEYLPSIIGVALTIAGVGYLVDSFAHFMMPNYADYADIFGMVVIIPGVIGELAFTLYLLIKGVKGTNAAKAVHQGILQEA